MKNWEIFEIDILNFLKKNYSNKNYNFLRKGGSDSTKADILVKYKNSVYNFFIEVKMDNSQCGQFVLLADEKSKKFKFSSRNKIDLTDPVLNIINYMNNHFDKHNNTKITRLNCDNELIENFIIEYYQNKNVKFIITKNTDYLILPLEKISDYFDIKGFFRVKKSGSRKLAKKWKDEFIKLYTKEFNANYKFLFKDKKAFIHTKEYIPDKTKLSGIEYDYYIKSKKDNYYEIRMLSNTRNSNFIVTLNLKNNIKQEQSDLKKFRNELEIGV